MSIIKWYKHSVLMWINDSIWQHAVVSVGEFNWFSIGCIYVWLRLWFVLDVWMPCICKTLEVFSFDIPKLSTETEYTVVLLRHVQRKQTPGDAFSQITTPACSWPVTSFTFKSLPFPKWRYTNNFTLVIACKIHDSVNQAPPFCCL